MTTLNPIPCGFANPRRSGQFRGSSSQCVHRQHSLSLAACMTSPDTPSRMDFSSMSNFDAPRVFSTRYLHGFVISRRCVTSPDTPWIHQVLLFPGWTSRARASLMPRGSFRTRYLHGFVVLRRFWTRILRGVTAEKCVSPARATADTHKPCFLRVVLACWLGLPLACNPPPLLWLGKVAFSAESAVTSEVSRVRLGGPSRSLATSSDFGHRWSDTASLVTESLRRDLWASPLPSTPQVGV